MLPARCCYAGLLHHLADCNRRLHSLVCQLVTFYPAVAFYPGQLLSVHALPEPVFDLGSGLASGAVLGYGDGGGAAACDGGEALFQRHRQS